MCDTLDMNKEDKANILGNLYHYFKYVSKEEERSRLVNKIYDQEVLELNSKAIENKYKGGHEWIGGGRLPKPFRIRNLVIENGKDYSDLVDKIMSKSIHEGNLNIIRKSLRDGDHTFRCPKDSVDCYLNELRVRLELLGKSKKLITLYLESTVGAIEI